MKYIADMQQLFIAYVLLEKLVSGFSGHKFVIQQQSGRRQYPTKYPSELKTTNLVELLQKPAVEHLTTFRQMTARDLGSVATIVTTDFEALYAYKRGDYQHCLQLSTQNVHTLLLYAEYMVNVSIFPEFIRLLDDDIVSLTALTLIVDPKCRCRSIYNRYFAITQLTLSLYLLSDDSMSVKATSLSDVSG